MTKKISQGLAKIKLGLQEKLYLGNIYSLRDWGHAEDYVEAMWLMLLQVEQNDLVFASAQQYSLKDFLLEASNHLDIDIIW